jgi:hypothetical protein
MSAKLKEKPAAAAATNGERAVLITTAHRGVFFGYAQDTDGETIKLRAARCCVYWSADVKGFLGLASLGPSANCRIGPPADLTLRNITAVAEVTSDAAAKWEAAPWK